MTTSINNGASASVSIPAGQTLTTTGTGIATMGPGPQAGQQSGLQGANSLGPWDYAATVYLTGTSSLSYTVAAPIMTSPASAADLFPVATVAALQALVSGGGFAVAPYVGAVASRCGISQSVGGAGNPQAMARTRHLAMDQIINPSIVYGNWFVNSSNIETAVGSTATIEASIEYPVGTFTRVTFGGVNQGSCAGGANIVSDAAVLTIPKGATFFVRTYWLSAAGMPYVIGNGLNNATGTTVVSGDYFGYGASIANTVLGGAINNTSVATTFKPLAIIATTRRPSWFSAGDSRLGLGNSGATFDQVSDALGLLGEHERYLGRDYAVIHAGRAGDSVRAATTNGYTLRQALSAYCSHISSNYGFNDLDGGARTAAVVLADLVTFAALFGGKQFWQSTISPASTGAWTLADLSDQTTKASNAQRVLLNASIRFGAPPFTGVFEVADQMESARDSGKWKAPGYTADGVHGTQAANMQMQAGIRYPAI